RGSGARALSARGERRPLASMLGPSCARDAHCGFIRVTHTALLHARDSRCASASRFMPVTHAALHARRFIRVTHAATSARHSMRVTHAAPHARRSVRVTHAVLPGAGGAEETQRTRAMGSPDAKARIEAKGTQEEHARERGANASAPPAALARTGPQGNSRR